MKLPKITVRQLRNMLNAVPKTADDLEIKVWLPGSTISLNGNGGKFIVGPGTLLIEGNIDRGSALDDLVSRG